MDIVLILKYVAVIVTLLTGLYSLLQPKKIKGFTGLEASSPRAITEIRAVMGGTFVGLGIAALVFPVREVYLMLGITYAAIAAIRGVSMVLDKSMEKSNVISLVSEVILVLILVL
ncbi:MAG: hypothetical protein CVU43_19590 [Chloroflexi bacterium HGW-Chloroflexi-5]|jgi:hypothetical protein|nr:MAG: hypothetical protein CVU43_19590 [Chloroflexi bacterium HGW-Chloroflexi-5]